MIKIVGIVDEFGLQSRRYEWLALMVMGCASIADVVVACIAILEREHSCDVSSCIEDNMQIGNR